MESTEFFSTDLFLFQGPLGDSGYDGVPGRTGHRGRRGIPGEKGYRGDDGDEVRKMCWKKKRKKCLSNENRAFPIAAVRW